MATDMYRSLLKPARSISLLALSCRAPKSGEDAEVPGEQGKPMQASTDGSGATPPETRSDDVVDTIHGRKVADPYRWLEDAKDPEVASWMTAGCPSRVSRSVLAKGCKLRQSTPLSATTQNRPLERNGFFNPANCLV